MKKTKKRIPVFDIREEYVRHAAEQMSRTIDFEVLAGMLVELGWFRFDVVHQPPTHSWVDIKDWVDENCTGPHQEHMGIWLFENEKDAIIFKLRWA